MDVAKILETIMLLMFGFSWPINLVKAYKARTAKATSLYFYIALEIGYLAGILAKFISNNVSYVLIFYFINFALILGCIAVYFRNKRLDKIEEEKQKQNS